MPTGVPAPELRDFGAWADGKPPTLQGLRGGVVLPHFRTLGSINRVRNYCTGRLCCGGAWRARPAFRYNRPMARTPPSPFPFPPKRMYWGADIPRRVIRRYARAIAEEFHPDRIILFGSHAYGTPHADSDVDLLVIMPTRDEHAQAVRIRWRLAAPFPLDLVVRTPKEVAWRLAEGESFLTTVVSQGKVLYEKDDPGVGAKGRARFPARRARQPKQGPAS